MSNKSILLHLVKHAIIARVAPMLTVKVWLLTLSVFVICSRSRAEYGGEGMGREWEQNARWQVMRESASKVMQNGPLLLLTGSPLLALREGYASLQQCVSHVFDEHIQTCVRTPAEAVAAALVVLTDYRTWLWPPDAVLADQVQWDVLARRLKPAVREDQCGHADKP